MLISSFHPLGLPAAGLLASNFHCASPIDRAQQTREECGDRLRLYIMWNEAGGKGKKLLENWSRSREAGGLHPVKHPS
ncbi:hypothetical protein BO79DRAFT_208130 [Aspergillus costaricaensis CBS 115574]|uniref:Uncharacterized protein n=1 Tax=Aspergillus costaricaensis CBS 115574 TaxID=1448317 RepID=A0ACD1IMH0_9EURO|nr:hypothetical protein BO79DRAFT_208130 [Aspergillus costaricaensis CBS 115574]RAK91313.1 hypothetical protein BO79DRAFT_208130 [Aspergillus costaricaensis CBS 115574]